MTDPNNLTNAVRRTGLVGNALDTDLNETFGDLSNLPRRWNIGSNIKAFNGMPSRLERKSRGDW